MCRPEVQLGTGRYIYGDLSCCLWKRFESPSLCFCVSDPFVYTHACVNSIRSGQQQQHLLFLVLIPVLFPFYGTGRDAAVVCLGCEIDVNGACPVACTARARHSATHQIIGASDKHALPTSDAPLAVARMCAFLPVLDAACVSIASTGCPLFYDRSFPPWISEQSRPIVGASQLCYLMFLWQLKHRNTCMLPWLLARFPLVIQYVRCQFYGILGTN